MKRPGKRAGAGRGGLGWWYVGMYLSGWTVQLSEPTPPTHTHMHSACKPPSAAASRRGGGEREKGSKGTDREITPVPVPSRIPCIAYYQVRLGEQRHHKKQTGAGATPEMALPRKMFDVPNHRRRDHEEEKMYCIPRLLYPIASSSSPSH